MRLKLPSVIGHRGAAAYAPENTIEGIHTAADIGVKWVELDVKLTKDDVPIMFHDEELDRTTNGSGLVAETTYEDIRHLETGSWFGESFTGIKIPTLEEAVDALLKRGMGLNLEIKPCPGRERETAEIALDLLSQIWDDHDMVLISSFQHVSLEIARDMANDWSRGLLLGGDEIAPNWAELADYLDVKTLNLGSRLVTPEIIEEAIALDLIPLVYTVNTPEEARLYQSMGVKTLFSDEPDLLLDAMLSVH
jgi:glycerophosphoryl diester phosphodiesterase